MYRGSRKDSCRDRSVGEKEPWKGLKGYLLGGWWGFCSGGGVGEDLLSICFEAQLFCSVIALLFAHFFNISREASGNCGIYARYSG